MNLIGEHTDYNNGFVMPIATPQSTEVSIAARADRRARLWSASVEPPRDKAEFVLGSEERRHDWSDYIAGVTVALREAGADVPGFDMTVTSTVPLGAGLSSSAALEVAVLRALNDRFDLALNPMVIARLAHRAESSFVGAPVGVMDQMAASLAGEDAALVIDTASMTYERVVLPDDTALIVIDSGVTHHHASGEYRVRRQECETAASLLGVASLREIQSGNGLDVRLPPPLDRRVRHVLTENRRVLEARDALQRSDAARFGRLMNASHASLRDDFEVSVADVDRLVTIAQSSEAVFGARMTGGGFGGSVVALAASGAAGRSAVAIRDTYNSSGSVEGRILIS